MKARSIDPKAIFLQAQSFYSVCSIVEDRVRGNADLQVQVGFPMGVIFSLTTELLLKCLIALEGGEVPRHHNLASLFEKLNDPLKDKIERKWNDEVVPLRSGDWDHFDAVFDKKMGRDIRQALRNSSAAFQELRYVYEGVPKTVFNISDLPTLLAQVIFDLKPEWKGLRRKGMPLPTSKS